MMQPTDAATAVAATAGRAATRSYTTAVLAIVAVKLLILAVDSMPRYFLWDSVTYLDGAIGNGLPRDRSFLYSLLIRAIAVPAHSLQPLVIAQTLAGVASAILVYTILRKFFSIRFGLALAAALLLAIEPAQLLYERMVMAEAFGGPLWLGFVMLALLYMRDGRVLWLCLSALAGIVAIAFRLNGTAVVLLVGPWLPLWRMWFLRATPEGGQRPGWRLFALHIAIALTATTILHVGYRRTVAAIAHSAPGYIGAEGLFLLGFVAPAIKENDFADTGCKSTVLSEIDEPLADPVERNYQLWGTGGLWAAMQRDCEQPEKAAGIVAHRASRRIASHILPMAFRIAAQYFDSAEAAWCIESDLGRKGKLPLELIESGKRYFSLDVRPLAFSDTPTSIWFQHSRWWLTGCFFLSPLAALGLILVTRRTSAAACARLLAVIVCGMFLTQFLLSPVMEFRYLHPFAPLMLVCLAVIAARLAEHFTSLPSHRSAKRAM